MSVEIPEGLKELLTEFTAEVLRNQPHDLLQFSMRYFRSLRYLAPASIEETQLEDEEELVAPVTNRFVRRAAVSAEPYNSDVFDEEDKEPRITHPKTNEQRNHLQEAFKDIFLFKNMEEEQMEEVLDAMYEKVVKKGEHVVNQGEDGDTFYVIERGSFNIRITIDGKEIVVGTYKSHGSFGELALMYNTPWVATIIAASFGALWCLDRMTFQKIVVRNNAKKRKLYEVLIKSHPTLSSLEPVEKMKLVDVLTCKRYRDGETIIAQGDVACCLYIIESGQVRLALDKGGSEVEESTYSEGQYFGELVSDKPQTASAYAMGNVKCLVMDIQAFERLLGPAIDIMKRNMSYYDKQMIKLFNKNTGTV
ncbi:cAMP-dependent protein kinase type II-alpha regulatory subunit-like [Xyrauchen texanus]|uniref:cAMP-dependent protein kinase type II-alpha regulatory subunit-like n=1 Tax=Xyrauchen texanus TaxID=154827 RepID=UPI002241935D|nr:cAMP-dependent protein kinase type II-alpha regulatory subunit-like [Xyrauchen texanus]